MWSIQRSGDAAHASPWTTRSYRIRSREESAQASLTLNVRTAEGDTVELSLDATSVRQRTSGSVRGQTAAWEVRIDRLDGSLHALAFAARYTNVLPALCLGAGLLLSLSRSPSTGR